MKQQHRRPHHPGGLPLRLEKLICAQVAQQQKGAEEECHRIIREIKDDKALYEKYEREYKKNPVMIEFCKKELHKKYC
ncbi:hypothetical protein Y032_0512g2749 [Ancylostoma ceylanicum]|uniref:Uncharacterized protein n=1 Tax=Ancylostoma ceylanicum TaxID=53326 RepID=A0A016WSV5_9BILA|nr:hypothetical protein Y032_0512g2749 [Ancylostoma ceylanicum]